MERKAAHISFVKSCRGFTLAELITAAGIIALTVFVLVGVLRKGNEISISTQHRQRARAIIDSCFESARLQYDNYVNLSGSDSASVLIDPRTESNPGDDLFGSLRIVVALDTNKTALTGQTTIDMVEYKRITISVTWNETQGSQTITVEKMVTKLDV